LDAKAREFDEVQEYKKVVVFYQDEGRFGSISNDVFCWVGEKKPNIPKQIVREYVYAFSALSPQTGDYYSIILPHCYTDAMSIFLSELNQNYADYRIISILNKAESHRSSYLKTPTNSKLLYFCQYSPELNPVELLWQQIKATYFNNLIFDNMDDVCKQLEIALKNMLDDKNKIMKLAKTYYSIIDSGLL
jgi:transposase